jgi:hypothetical protein
MLEDFWSQSLADARARIAAGDKLLLTFIHAPG